MDLRSVLRRLAAGTPEAEAEAWRLIGSESDESVRLSLTDVFADGDAGLPGAMARLLTGRTDPRLVRVLLPLLRNENPRVRNAARGILEKTGAEAPDPIVEFSRDPDSRMRIFATTILGAIGPGPAVPRLLEMLADRDETVADCAVAALGSLRAEAAVPALAAFLERRYSWIRLSALDALMRIGTPSAVRAILSAVPGADADTLSILVSVLSRLEADAPPALAAEIRAVASRAQAR